MSVHGGIITYTYTSLWSCLQPSGLWGFPNGPTVQEPGIGTDCQQQWNNASIHEQQNNRTSQSMNNRTTHVETSLNTIVQHIRNHIYSCHDCAASSSVRPFTLQEHQQLIKHNVGNYLQQSMFTTADPNPTLHSTTTPWCRFWKFINQQLILSLDVKMRLFYILIKKICNMLCFFIDW